MRDERLFPFHEKLDSLPGVGAKMSQTLERLLGGDTVWDLLLHLPERWLERRIRTSFDTIEEGEVVTVCGEVHAYHAPHSSRAPHRIQLFDGTGFLTVSFFRADGRWLQGQFPIGKQRIVSGKVEDYRGERQISHPDYILDPEKPERPPVVEPIYRLTAGLTNKRLHGFILKALEILPEALPEWINPPLKQQRNWPGFLDAMHSLHAPEVHNEDLFLLARERLAYDEALARETTFALVNEHQKNREAPNIKQSIETVSRLVKSLPYEPTNAQTRAFNEIASDMASSPPMRRMLQGDVGAGKTLVGAMAAVHTVASGFQAVFMAPTEVLARQQYETLSALLSPLGYTVSVLTGRDKGTSREATLLGLQDGSIQIIAGTHALFQESVQFRNLGLVIVDEQHRFGVQDRMRLLGKARSPHMLVMSATPIPRTLAQAVNGDLDVSILEEKPAGRKPVETRILPDTRLDDIIAAVGRATQRGERAFWVCTKVDVEDDDATAVNRSAMLQEVLQTKVGLVHGRLKADQKDEALESFRNGDTRILVATTVIEVGVDVPDATIMVIERAENFGLAQLHQLRGRVGRGDKESYCLLVYHPPLGELAQQRLDALRQTEDGFEIAEIDFKLRGPGDMLGVRQAGAIDYRVIDLTKHASLLEIARKDARHFVQSDPNLRNERGQAIRLLRDLLAPHIETASSN